jgi:hypothetical protein
VQGEPHVGTAIVYGVYPAVVEEERERVSGDSDGSAPSCAYVLQPSSPYEAI